jgi:hypothetical protein
VASLQARSSLRSAHPLFVVNKLISLTAFFVLLCAGWVVVSFLKSDTFDRWRHGSPDSVSGSRSATTRARDASTAEANTLIAPTRLVYSCADDKDFFHTSTHLPARCERTALSEEAASQRGLKRCQICFPE